MLRLDPAHPPLWRSSTTLQFGFDAVAVVENPEPWQEHLLRELERGIPEVALDPVAMALGAPEFAALAFVERIAHALAPATARCDAVTLQVPDGFARSVVDAVIEGFSIAEVDVEITTWFGAPNEVAAYADASSKTMVLLAQHLVEPRRVAALMACDIPHLPLVFTGARALVGPSVVPGQTPCLACLAAHHRDRDPAWPLMAAQMLGRTPPDVSRALAVDGAIAAARMLSETERNLGRSRWHSMILREDSPHRVSRTYQPHAACRCRSLAEISTEAGREYPVPMTPRALARPA